jgi:hypothetical protein
MLETARTHGTHPRLVVVTSETHFWADLDAEVRAAPSLLGVLSSRAYCVDQCVFAHARCPNTLTSPPQGQDGRALPALKAAERALHARARRTRRARGTARRCMREPRLLLLGPAPERTAAGTRPLRDHGPPPRARGRRGREDARVGRARGARRRIGARLAEGCVYEQLQGGGAE